MSKALRDPVVAVCGSVNVDLIAYAERLPRPGETLIGRDFVVGQGGKGANQCVQCARLGGVTRFVAAVGENDVFGAAESLRRNGIDTSHVLVKRGASTGVAPITVDANGRNCIVVVPGANALLTPEDVSGASEAFRGARVVVCQLEVPVETTEEALRQGRAAGALTILNPAPAVKSLPASVLGLCDVLAPNETELEILSGGMPVGSISEVEAAARHLLDLISDGDGSSSSSKAVLVTLGSRGCLVVTRSQVTHVPGEHVDKVVDTTGAGDSFIGALAFFLSLGFDLPTSCRKSNLVASHSVRHPGTQTSFPSRSDLPSDLFH